MKSYYATFLGINGYEIEREEAKRLLTVGEKYKIVGGNLSDCSSSFLLDGFGQVYFNTVMFDHEHGAWSLLDDHSRSGPMYYQK